MQTINVTEVKGPLGKGEKKFFAVVDDKGAEFTTFDTAVEKLTPGSVIEAEIEVVGKYTNIKSYTVTSTGTGPAAKAEKPNSAEMTPEAWAEKDRLERFSIETQTAFKGIIELAVAKVITLDNSYLGKALEWADKHFTESISVKEALQTAPHLDKEKPDNGDELFGTFKDVGEFFTACLKIGVSRTQALEKLGLDDKSDLSKLNLADAWAKVNE